MSRSLMTGGGLKKCGRIKFQNKIIKCTFTLTLLLLYLRRNVAKYTDILQFFSDDNISVVCCQ